MVAVHPDYSAGFDLDASASGPDAAFDRGLISFTDDGHVLASPELSECARGALQLESARRLTGLHDEQRANLAFHRHRNGF
jgi:putative restriction endonuclease